MAHDVIAKLHTILQVHRQSRHMLLESAEARDEQDVCEIKLQKERRAKDQIRWRCPALTASEANWIASGPLEESTKATKACNAGAGAGICGPELPFPRLRLRSAAAKTMSRSACRGARKKTPRSHAWSRGTSAFSASLLCCRAMPSFPGVPSNQTHP